MKGDDVNLTCGAESFPPSSIIWTKGGSNLTLQSGQGSQSLVIPNVTVEDSGLYFCTVKYLNHTMELCAEVVVTSHSLLQLVSRPEVIIAFRIGVLLSAVVFVLAIIGYRRKKKTSKNSDWTVELSSHDNPQILGQHDEDEAVEAAGSQDSKDVNHATLDFSKIKKRSPQEAARYHEAPRRSTPKSKKEVTGVREEESGDEEEMLEENEEEKMMEKETENGAPSEEVEATYCNVKEVIGEI
ncbi:uncharacterized protein LOC114477642 [Gouania willdenowi]|uniref:uncharacterized protein LOC114477642 n=1 Tax=Gouania willdenowi TaxID=441366 RepID=UPI0010555FE8|nr:uncharacterized protein LOC114477642 [Gouania willdenowi]